MARPFAFLSLAVLLFAGCVGPGEPAPAARPVEEPSGEAPVTAAKEGLSAFARSLEEKWHAHDAWSGRHQIVLMDAEVASRSAAPDPWGLPFPLALLFGGPSAVSVGRTDFRLPDGVTVPPETEWLEAQVRWDGSPTITGLRFGYGDALSRGIRFTAPLKPAEIIRINSTVDTNDIPHTSVSKWRFALLPYNERDPSMPGAFNGTARVTITAFRSTDALQVAPPHPDHWGDDVTMRLLDVKFAASQRTIIIPPFILDDGQGFDEVELADGSIVLPHTKLLRIELKWTNDDHTTDVMRPYPGIVWSTAGGRDLAIREPDRRSADSSEYVVATGPRDWDSPYANATNWWFYLYLTNDQANSVETPYGPWGQVAAFDGEIVVAITAYREESA